MRVPTHIGRNDIERIIYLYELHRSLVVWGIINPADIKESAHMFIRQYLEGDVSLVENNLNNVIRKSLAKTK